MPLSIKMITLALSLYISSNIISACTTLTIQDRQGSVYQGRTMEFGSEFPFSIAYYPQGTSFTSSAPAGSVGLQFVAKHSFIGVSGKIDNKGSLYLADGINDKGLTFTLNSFKSSHGPQLKSSHALLNGNDLGSWVLSQFSTVAEAKDALSKQDIWLSPIALFANAEFPFHIAVFDKTGKGIVIEYINGKQVISDNPVGIMTNGPDFDWHLTNLNNYTSLSNRGTPKVLINGYPTHAVDVGGNLLGLPADDASPSRFVRAAFYSNYAEKPESGNAIAVLGKIMNKFDRVKGITAFDSSLSNSETISSKDKTQANNSGEWTLWTSLRDLNHNTYYIRPEDSLNYYKFDLQQLNKSGRQFTVKLSELASNSKELAKVMN